MRILTTAVMVALAMATPLVAACGDDGAASPSPSASPTATTVPSPAPLDPTAVPLDDWQRYRDLYGDSAQPVTGTDPMQVPSGPVLFTWEVAPDINAYSFRVYLLLNGQERTRDNPGTLVAESTPGGSFNGSSTWTVEPGWYYLVIIGRGIAWSLHISFAY
jgi:hypothetical protein